MGLSGRCAAADWIGQDAAASGARDMVRDVTVLGDGDPDEIVAYVSDAQTDPTRHVTYVGKDRRTVRSELGEADGWRDRTFVARSGDAVVGVLTADIGAERRKVWWLGPWSDDEETATSLLDAATDRLGHLFDEEEFALDARNGRMIEVARARGATRGESSLALERTLTRGDGRSHVDVRPVAPTELAAVAALHDELFPATHTAGSALVDDADTTVLVTGTPPVGYVAMQLQADGRGYIDFLGVAPAARRTGHARRLLLAALALLAEGGAPGVHLTVRVGRTGARELYASLGFTEACEIVPYTRLSPGRSAP